MKLALLGTDSDILQLVAAATSDGHEIVWVGDVRPADAGALRRFVPEFTDCRDDWELLLDRNSADAVLIGRGTSPDDLRAEQLKRLTTEAVPLLVVHPACASVLAYYEVDMARRETGGIVRHYNPIASHPIISELATWVREGHPAIGPIQRLTCERRVATVDRPHVMASLFRDVELLAAAAGHIRRVSAIGPRASDARFGSLQVQMTCNGPVTLHWTVAPLAGVEANLTLYLVGEEGTVSLHGRSSRVADEGANSGIEWELVTSHATEDDRQLLAPYDAAATAVRQLADTVATRNDQPRIDASTWATATRAMEVADAVELSLEKGRTIEVYQQQFTERLAFRGTMAALGCGLLLFGLLVIAIITLLGGVEGKDRPQLLPSWPIILLAVLAFFLLMQTVPLLIAKSKRTDWGDADDDTFQ
jgi:hypothetical protein